MDQDVEFTREDLVRARDRWRVERVRQAGGRRNRLLLLWMLIGPGILVMLGENDGPSMISYAATGSQFGVGFFIPFVVATFAMAFVVQEMTVRLGAVTHRGHAELIFERFGPFWGRFAMGDLVLSNLLTLVTEFIAIQAGLGFFGVPPLVSVSAAFGVVAVASATRRYWSWERLVLGLAIFNALFVPVALMAHPDFGQVGHALLTWQPFPGRLSMGTLTVLLADIGATVTPWMLFFQQGAVTDKGLNSRDIRMGRIDTALGGALAALFAVAAIVATAPLFRHHVNAAQLGAAQFAQALLPYVGHVGAALFALGIFEAGLVAAVAISTSSGYAYGEVSGKAHSLNRSILEAKGFYMVLLGSAALAAVLVLIPGAPLEAIVLLVNVVAVLTMPPALVLLFMLVNDREIMGAHANRLASNLAGGLVVVFITAAGIFYGLTAVFSSLHV